MFWLISRRMKAAEEQRSSHAARSSWKSTLVLWKSKADPNRSNYEPALGFVFVKKGYMRPITWLVQGFSCSVVNHQTFRASDLERWRPVTDLLIRSMSDVCRWSLRGCFSWFDATMRWEYVSMYLWPSCVRLCWIHINLPYQPVQPGSTWWWTTNTVNHSPNKTKIYCKTTGRSESGASLQ